MKMGFLGASVTAQGFDHQTKSIVGYRHILSNMCKENLNFSIFGNFSYPGNRLSDAGLIKIYEVLNFNPDYLIVEPLIENSTIGEEATIDEIIYLYKTMLINGVQPITLMLPNPKTGSCKDWPNYENFKFVSNSLNVSIIEIKFSNFTESNNYFNGVHTTSEGAKFLGEKIYNQLVQILKVKYSGISITRSSQATLTYKPSVHVKKLGFTSENQLFHSKLRLNSPGRLRIIQKSKIGPYSPNIKYNITSNNGSLTKETSLWDPYCHYERGTYSILLPTIQIEYFPTDIYFSISENKPNYSICRRNGIKWPDFSELRLNPIEDAFIISNRVIDYKIIV